jgi:hypothetical protein
VANYIRDVERIAGRVVAADDEKDLLFSLQSLGGRAALMRLTRKGAMDGDEFARWCQIAYAANTARDYLLGAIYEMKRALATIRSSRLWDGDEEAMPHYLKLCNWHKALGRQSLSTTGPHA